MKITVHTDKETDEVRIDVTCREVTPEIEKMIATLRMLNRQLTGRQGNRIFQIPVGDVIYIEAVERKCFLYTQDNYFEADFRLYELEELLGTDGFIRISKSVLINLQEVASLQTELNRRLLVTMCNGERLIASRQYADELKKLLGVKA